MRIRLISKQFSLWGILSAALLKLSFAQEGKQEMAYQKVLPLLEEYCYDCHGDGAQKGGFAIDELISLGSFSDHKENWDKIWKNIYNRNMPPANIPQPHNHEISTILSWIEKNSFEYEAQEIDPGHVVLRRLNRTEYKNTIYDLFQVKVDAENYFPADDTGYGFDTIGEVLTLSPLLMEKYLAMGEKIMTTALGPVSGQEERVQFNAEGIKGGILRGNYRVMPSRGSFMVNHLSNLEGMYEVKVWASASRAGNEFAKMAVNINGKVIKTFLIDSKYPNSSVYKFRFFGKENFENKLSFSFINDFYDPQNKNPNLRDRNLYLEKIEILKPFGVNSRIRESRKRLLGEWDSKIIGDAHAIESLEKWLPRIYRMPLSEKDINKHTAFYDKMKERELPPIEALRNTFKAALVSPRFIFREERISDQKSNLKYNQIDEFALAHRMSYLLWSTIPDDQLWERAQKGELRANLHNEFTRMMNDKKINEFVKNFCGQWLQLKDLNLINPNPEQFPEFTNEIRNSFIRETEEFFKFLLTKNLNVDLLLGANFSMINKELANYYGLEGNFDQEFKKVIFRGNDLNKRGGLLTHGSILTITSNPTRTSPVKRGKWILDNLLAAPPRSPPPGVAELEEPHDTNTKKLTFREQMTQHSKNPACYSCHASMDNLGYALENFDAVGNWRTVDGGKGVNATGKLYSGEEFNGVHELQIFLKQHKSDALIRCITQKLFTYGLGRGITYKDRIAVDRVVNSFQKNEVKLADLVLEFIKSKPFQFTD